MLDTLEMEKWFKVMEQRSTENRIRIDNINISLVVERIAREEKAKNHLSDLNFRVRAKASDELRSKLFYSLACYNLDREIHYQLKN